MFCSSSRVLRLRKCRDTCVTNWLKKVWVRVSSVAVTQAQLLGIEYLSEVLSTCLVLKMEVRQKVEAAEKMKSEEPKGPSTFSEV